MRTTQESNTEAVTLYGTPLSLYTGRARSYLIKAGIQYREITPTTRHYAKEVLPLAGRRASIPTIELPDGQVVRDGVAIVDHFEALSANAFSPTKPNQRIVSLLFDVIGAEGLLRPAMHYRWNFPEQNAHLLDFHFESVMPPGPDRFKKGQAAANRMRAACRAFGAVPETFGLVESLYAGLIDRLNVHFSVHPYLLGGKPCVGDFGLIAPMYGHLGLASKPLSILQARAIRVLRWVERMNRPEPDSGEFENAPGDYLDNDAIPETLISVLRQIAVDFVPETRAACSTINAWLDQQPELEPGTEVVRGVGQCAFTPEAIAETHVDPDLLKTAVSALAQPFRFYLLSRVQDEFESLSPSAQDDARSLLQAAGMSELLELKLARKIGRQDNLEVWL